MSYYIIAETIAHQFTIATGLETPAEARNSAKILLGLPGSTIQRCCIMDTKRAVSDELVTTVIKSGE